MTLILKSQFLSSAVIRLARKALIKYINVNGWAIKFPIVTNQSLEEIVSFFIENLKFYRQKAIMISFAYIRSVPFQKQARHVVIIMIIAITIIIFKLACS